MQLINTAIEPTQEEILAFQRKEAEKEKTHKQKLARRRDKYAKNRKSKSIVEDDDSDDDEDSDGTDSTPSPTKRPHRRDDDDEDPAAGAGGSPSKKRKTPLSSPADQSAKSTGQGEDTGHPTEGQTRKQLVQTLFGNVSDITSSSGTDESAIQTVLNQVTLP